jgi:hypothetical protein
MENEEDMASHQATHEGVQSIQASHPGGRFVEIHVKGHLNSEWSDWLGSLQIKLLDSGEMILAGYLADQAALMGILNRLYGLNLALLSVNAIDQGDQGRWPAANK